MATKDDRQIHQGVWVDGELHTDPDKLAEVLTPEMAERLTASGAISGTWATKKAATKGGSKEKADK